MKIILTIIIISGMNIFGNDSIPEFSKNGSVFKLEREVLKKPLKNYKQNAMHTSDYIKFAETELQKLAKVKYDRLESKGTGLMVNIYLFQLVNNLIDLAIKADPKNRQLGIIIKSECYLLFGSNLDYLKTDSKDTLAILTSQILNMDYCIKHFSKATQLLSDSLDHQLLTVGERKRASNLIVKLINMKIFNYDQIAEKFNNAPIPITLTNDENRKYQEFLKQKSCEYVNEELIAIDDGISIYWKITTDKSIEIQGIEKVRTEISIKYSEYCK